jgi:tetratricopeptide (TPR) repeat protein
VTGGPAFPTRRIGRLGALGLLGLLAGCGAPDRGPPPMLRAAARQTRLGEDAYLLGRADEAIPALTEAVRLHLAAGDLPGASRALVNLALAQRSAGDGAGAGATAARLHELAPAARQQAGEQNRFDEASAASAWLDALLALDRGDAAEATACLERAPSVLPVSPPWSGRLATLRAEIDLGAGRFAEAVTHAQAGRSASVAARDEAEEARALRISGSAHMGLGQWVAARGDFLTALKIEESLGGGTRMAADLNHLATVSEHLGDAAGAELYAQRAKAIAAAH